MVYNLKRTEWNKNMLHCKKNLDNSDLKIIIVNTNGKIYAVKITLTGGLLTWIRQKLQSK